LEVALVLGYHPLADSVGENMEVEVEALEKTLEGTLEFSLHS